MPKFRLNKLVRDKIVEKNLADGNKPSFHTLDDTDHKAALIEKLTEEALEIINADTDDVAGEIADVQQALDDLKLKYGLTNRDIALAQEKKNIKNGSFSKGLYIDYIELDEDNEWTAYYRKDPDRFEEFE